MFLAVSCHLRYNEIVIVLYSVSLDTVVRSLEQYLQINAKTKDVVWNYLGIFFSLGSQVIWLPVLLHYLPPDILGLWYVFVSIGGLVELMDSGFTPTLSHCMTYAWSGAANLKKHGVLFIVFATIGIPIVEWLRHDFTIERPVFLVMACSLYLMARHRNSACFISTMNRLSYTFSFIFFGILTLLCTYIGLSHFSLGLWGIVLIPLVVQSLYNNWKWNQVVNHYLRTTEYGLMKSGLKILLEMACKKWKKITSVLWERYIFDIIVRVVHRYDLYRCSRTILTD